jgi:hypothetical protein
MTTPSVPAVLLSLAILAGAAISAAAQGVPEVPIGPAPNPNAVVAVSETGVPSGPTAPDLGWFALLAPTPFEPFAHLWLPGIQLPPGPCGLPSAGREPRLPIGPGWLGTLHGAGR